MDFRNHTGVSELPPVFGDTLCRCSNILAGEDSEPSELYKNTLFISERNQHHGK